MNFISSTNDIRSYLGIKSSEKNIEFSKISTDTRSIEKGSLFIAIKGPNFDGNDFIEKAFEKGATAVLCSDEYYKDNDVNIYQNAIIYVPSVRKALIQIATDICDKFAGKKILITGSNGKTTCTYLLGNSLTDASSTIGNYNNEIGLPLSIMQSDKDSKYLVMEAGAGKPGDISTLSKIMKPDIGIITSISESHTQALTNLDGVFLEKTSVIDHIPENGYLIMNFDFIEARNNGFDKNKDLFKRLEKNAKKNQINLINVCEESKNALSNINYNDDLSTMYFSVAIQNQKGYSIEDWKTALVGAQNVKNIVLIRKVLEILNEEYSRFRSLLDYTSDRINRLTHHKWKNGSHLIDDTYNANPDSLFFAINLLSNAPRATTTHDIHVDPPTIKYRRRILILGDMLELNDPIKTHRNIGKKIHQGIDDYFESYREEHELLIDFDVLITFGKLSGVLSQSIIEQGIKINGPVLEIFSFFDGRNSVEEDDEEKRLKSFLDEFIKKDDIVIIKGSRGMRMERFI